MRRRLLYEHTRLYNDRSKEGDAGLRNDALQGKEVRLAQRQPPPPHYYAANLLVVVETVLGRYADLLSDDERAFGEGIARLDAAPQRLLARLLGRRGTLVREDTLRYPEVPDADAALAALATAGLVERNAAAPLPALLGLCSVGELEGVFREVDQAKARKAERVARIAAYTPASLARWRLRRRWPWVRLVPGHLDLYRLLFFGSRRGDLTTFIMRDLGVARFEPVPLCADTRQFEGRDALDAYLALLAAEDAVAALGDRPDADAVRAQAPRLIAGLWDVAHSRLLEHRRSRVLCALARKLERARAFDAALTCYRRATEPPARERRMRILRRLQDAEGVEALRAAILRRPHTALEADFATRFGRRVRRPLVPTVVRRVDPAATSVEAHAARIVTASGGVAWHLENDLPMGLFGLAYWSWVFAPVRGAFVHPFQTGPVDLFWPGFFAAREGLAPGEGLAKAEGALADPLAAELKPLLRATLRVKAGTANRLFNWQRFTPVVAEALIDALPEAHLRALVEIVRDDLPGKRTGFPDLTVLYGPGRYEFVEVKGPNDALRIHQRLWIEALRRRDLPVRVLRLRA